MKRKLKMLVSFVLVITMLVTALPINMIVSAYEQNNPNSQDTSQSDEITVPNIELNSDLIKIDDVYSDGEQNAITVECLPYKTVDTNETEVSRQTVSVP